MRILKAENLAKSIGEKVLWQDLTFSIMERERIGIVGVNGTGKSTLLKAIADQSSVDSGTITKPKDYTIMYLPQDPEFNPENTVIEQVLSSKNPVNETVKEYENIVEELSKNPEDEKLQERYYHISRKMDELDGWNRSTRAKTILSKLGIENVHEKIGPLSGGQKKRVALAEVLLHPADLLLLDEPTNHLDFQMMEWLKEELNRLPSAILFVTHDRYFLDGVATKIFEIADDRLYTYTGNYKDYIEQKALREEEEAIKQSKARNLYRRELAWIKRGAKARSTKQKARIQRFKELEKSLQNKPKESLVVASKSSRLGKDVIEMKDCNKSFGGVPILKNFSLLVKPKDRIGIAGVNGSGKSTFLNIISGKEPLDEGVIKIGQTVKMAYFPQQIPTLDGNKLIIDFIRETKEQIHTEGKIVTASQMLERFLFPMSMQRNFIRTLSGGEKKRLYLLKLLMEEPNVLLLDEPTNDLDTVTLTVLENFLEDFNGVVIAVSHDRYFLDKVCDQLLIFHGKGHIEKVYGTYSEYLKEAIHQQQNSQPVKDNKMEERKHDLPQKKKKMSYMEKREWEEIDEKIASCEEKLAQIQEEMASAGSDYDRLEKLMVEERNLNEQLERLIERWAYLSELADS